MLVRMMPASIMRRLGRFFCTRKNIDCNQILVFMWLLTISLTWFHGTGVTICNADTTVHTTRSSFSMPYGVFGVNEWKRCIGFRSPFSQCTNYMRFSKIWFCFRRQEATNIVLICYAETPNLDIVYDLRDLTGNISSIMTKHMGVQCRLC